jgi:hypothetical protein
VNGVRGVQSDAGRAFYKDLDMLEVNTVKMAGGSGMDE